MKTKIIYISGAEIFEISDIRAAFEEVRTALNLDKSTILFGVPVDAEDAGLSAKDTDFVPNTHESKTVDMVKKIVNEETIAEPETKVVETPMAQEIRIESVKEEEQQKKRGRPRKEDIVEEISEEITDEIIENEPEQILDSSENVTKEPETTYESDEVVVPILSVLSTKAEDDIITKCEPESDIDIIPEITDEEPVSTEVFEDGQSTTIDDDEDADAKLEKLLSAMTPLKEDILEDNLSENVESEPELDPMDTSVDATLEQLATEFIENQDKIAAETKSTSRSKIGKLRNILPFKQSKHKDNNGLGDLFGWAGIAANDEDFSVPGFFTSAASKK